MKQQLLQYNIQTSTVQLKILKRFIALLKIKALFIVYANPLALGLLTPPGSFGADIVVGDTQPFGIPAQFGGPHCGYFATTKS